ncbi:hypothetical protein J4H86_06585 [Spiractinospora alimapuensis]|uniref:contact-dependent growth inhibition system immunity protein n=1 Tax=Spiractinospora alimapuensis TaxID=2820884 RepID=UPI001EEB73D4|nr:contact-dependent growth inhibition system immunity protein [Spiractinospora alimapuensis]QVQ53420.1 hypothetical protein J4H86_06585 [Spiractinospora alimapuensis]
MYDQLSEFLRVSFHQDWKDDFPDERASVRHFVATMSRSRCVAVLAELDELLAVDVSDKRLRGYITRDSGANIVPPNGPDRWHTWLRTVRDHLADAVT